MAQYTLTFKPSGYNTSHTSAGTVSNISNAYTNSASTTYATVATNTTAQATTYISLTFDLSSIPSNATIDSVACYTKGSVNNTSTNRTATFVAQLYNDSTAMGSSVSIGAVTTATAANITSTGTWTRTALDNLELRFTHTRGTSTNSLSMYLYGADLVITYTEVESHTVTNTITNGVLISPTIESMTVTDGDACTITFSGNSNQTFKTMTVAGTEVTPTWVESSSSYEYTIASVTADTDVVITFETAGPTLYVKGSSGWVKVTTIYRKTSDTTWEEVSTTDFDTSASSSTYKFVWKESEEATVIGSVTKGTNEISLDDSLPSDTYTLYYEDDDDTPLDNWNAIGTITK